MQRASIGAAPNGNWNPDNGQVNLNWDHVDNRDDNLGVRPAVRAPTVRISSTRRAYDQYLGTWLETEIIVFR